jgi:hypothetical protein
MTLKGKTRLAAILAGACGVVSVHAQQPETAVSLFNLSTERIRAALQTPQPIAGAVDNRFFTSRQPNDFRYSLLPLSQPQPGDLRLGPLTLMQCPTLFICVNVPAGDLVSRAAHSMAAAKHRGAENAAHAEVVKALAQFERARPQ